ncbi:hypothetical protein MRX96_055518 [Rhipicephalus microplus]
MQRASKMSKSRGKTRLTRAQWKKRETSSNVENGDATPSAQATSKMQERRDDAPTKGRVSIVLRALSEPDLLTPVEVDCLVRVVFWKAIHDDDIAEPAATFCARVITAEQDGVFIDRLLWTCRDWLKKHDVPLRRSTARVLGSRSRSNMLVERLRKALTTAGEAAERGAPARMAALVACLRDAFLSSDVPEDDRLTLLELIELRASGWKLSLEQQLSYASLGDAVGDECDDVQNLSPLPWRIAE